MTAKKLILFLVEGVTDKTCIGSVLDQLISNQQVRFEITDGDITTKDGSNAANILSRIGNIVNDFRSRFGLKPKDFLEVVHLIDMDGAYIADGRIKYSEVGKNCYADSNISTNKVEETKQRNIRKRAIINRLITINAVCRTIPYSAYYFSCNLDHVLHNRPNLNQNEKMEYANSFEDQYIDCPESFVDFLEQGSFAVPGDYTATWNFIRIGENSLRRYTNFQLYFTNPRIDRG